MNKRTLAFSLALLVSTASWADDTTTVSLGLRVWANEWSSWDVFPAFPVGRDSLPGYSQNYTSGSRAVPIPSLTVRTKDLLFSASHFVRTRYSFEGDSGAFTARRQETDALVGYYVLPTLAVTLGYKEVKQDFGSNARFKYSGPIFGAVASAPLTAGFSLYGNFGYGRMNARLPLADALRRSSFKADYLLGEVGLAYSLDVRSFIQAAKALTLTLGYRNQVLATQGYRIPLSATTPSLNRETDLRDTTEGYSLGLNFSF